MMSKVTPNQNIRPITTKINEKGHIEIGGCDLVEIAKEFSTPLYIYDEETIRQMCKSYKDAFKDCEKVHFLFASKAFMTKAIVQILHQEGFGFDVVSGGEMYTVANTLGTLESCIFNGNNKTYQELEMALNFNIKLVSVDNFDELKLLMEKQGKFEIYKEYYYASFIKNILFALVQASFKVGGKSYFLNLWKNIEGTAYLRLDIGRCVKLVSMKYYVLYYLSRYPQLFYSLMRGFRLFGVRMY